MSCHVMSCRHYCIDNYKNFFTTITNNFFDHTLCESFACIKSFVERGMAIFRYMPSFVLVTDKNFKLDKLQRLFNELFSVVYKKFYINGGFRYEKSN